MQITINLDSQADRRAALDFLLGLDGATASPEPTATSPEPTPAPKAAPPKKAAAPKVVEEPVVEEENLVGGEDPAALKERAVQAATELVTTGQSAKVREALSALGAKRVSDLTGDAVQAFLTAISA